MSTKSSYSSLGSAWTQFFPQSAQFTDKDVSSAAVGDRVFLVTGANSGMGLELARILYAKGGKVYITCRTEAKATATIEHIKSQVPEGKGSLISLILNLEDLDQVKTAALEFLAREGKLHVLFNNAGVMVGPQKPMLTTKQGHELALGVNCVGTFLFTKLIAPVLAKTAATSPPNTVRVVWLSSFGLQQYAPKGRGIDLDNLTYKTPKANIDRYGISKCGVWLLSVEFARRFKEAGIVSVPVNPGNLATALARDQILPFRLITSALVHPPLLGVYSQLYAAFSKDIANETVDWSKQWVIPWGRLVTLRPDLEPAAKPEDDGGNGNAVKFWDWNEAQVKSYV